MLIELTKTPKETQSILKSKNRFSLPLVIAGPCSAESRGQVWATAKQIENLPYVQFFRAGLWKPRTRANQFEGMGEKGIPWLREVANQTTLKVITEVASPKHIELIAKENFAGVWLGARTVANPFMMEELARSLHGTSLTVMVKNPVNADLNLWCGAIERLRNHGVELEQIVAIHRGFSSFNSEKRLRNAPYWKIPFEFKRLFPQIPLVCDPSHITGKREYVAEIATKAICLGFDGLMIETHPTPSAALSDASQQITPHELEELLKSLPWRCAHEEIGLSAQEQLQTLRTQIDEIDHELIEMLSLRQKVVSEIATIKKENKMTILQMKRFEEMLHSRIASGKELELNPELIKEIFSLIHEDSTSYQSGRM